MIGLKAPIKVLLVDDHPVVRRGLRSCLNGSNSVIVVDEAIDGPEALNKIGLLRPDVALMDVDMPRMSGLEVTRQVRRNFPEVKVVILTIHNTQDYLLQFVRCGAHGFVLKEATPETLIEAIHTVYAGKTFFTRTPAALFHCDQFNRPEEGDSPRNILSTRELEVLACIAEGRSNKDIANLLELGVRTIESHREKVMTKLKIRSVAGLTKYAITHGIVSLD